MNFCQAVDRIIQKKSTSLDEVLEALALLPCEPPSPPLLSQLALKWFFQFDAIRTFFLYPVLRSWQQKQKKQLEHCTEESVTAYNLLIQKLFSRQSKTLMLSLSEHKAFAEEEKNAHKKMLCKQAASFEDLLHSLEEQACDLTCLEKEINERNAKIHALHLRQARLVSERKNVAASIPPSFADSVTYKEKWTGALQELIRPLEIKEPARFSTKQAFYDWMSEQEKMVAAVEEAISLFKRAHQADAAFRIFLSRVQRCHPPLFSACGAGFVHFIEENLFTSQESLLPLIDKQQEELLAIDRDIEMLYREMKRKALFHFDAFTGADLRPYQDLPQAASLLLEKVSSAPFEGITQLTDENKKIILSKVATFADHLERQIAALVLQGRERNQHIQEMNTFKAEYGKLLQGLSHYADMQKEHTQELQSLQKLNIDKKSFPTMSPQEIDAVINHHYAIYQTLRKNVFEKLHIFDEKIHLLYTTGYESLLTLKHRLFEIFSHVTPYPDLGAPIAALHHNLQRHLEEQVTFFFSGKSSIDDLTNAISQLSFDHDVLQLRNELSSRAARLNDLRQEARKTMRLLQQARRSLDIIETKPNDPLYSKIVTHTLEMQKTLHHIEDPFHLFANSLTFESVNSTIKRIWMQLEENQTTYTELKQKTDNRLNDGIQLAQKKLLSLLDDIEETERALHGKKPTIYNLYVQQIQNTLQWESLEKCMNEIEQRFLYIQPILFFMAIPDMATRRVCIRLSYDLLQQITATTSFAKSLQYMKTFEEERIDTILEVFEKCQEIEEETASSAEQAWKKYYHSMLSYCDGVIEESIFDIGFLTMQALLDIDESTLIHTMQLVIQKAKETLIPSSIKRLKTLLSHEILTTSSIEQLIHALTMLEQEKKDTKQTLRFYLTSVQHICLLLFEAKIMMHAAKKNSLALASYIGIELRYLIDDVEKFLQKKRSIAAAHHHDEAAPWIEECCLMRKELMLLEIEEPTPSLYSERVNTLIARIEEIEEISTHSVTEWNFSEKKQKIQKLLQLMTSLPPGQKQEAHISFLPGDLTFFNSNSY